MSNEIKMGTNSCINRGVHIPLEDCILKFSYWVVARVSYYDSRNGMLGKYHDYTQAGRFDLDHKFNKNDIDDCANKFRDQILDEHKDALDIQVVITFFGLLES